MMQKIVPANFKRMPWKNGGGETAEIAIGPSDATAAGFDWRVSMARVAAAGPFSTFDGIDRTLAVLSGQGLRLTTDEIGTRRTVVLNVDSDPYRFAGEAIVSADLIDGAGVTDFNMMTRRASCSHALRRLIVTEPITLSADVVILYVAAGQVACRDGMNPISTELHVSDGEAIVAQSDETGRNAQVRLSNARNNSAAATVLAAQVNFGGSS